MSDAMEFEQLLGFLAGWMKADRDYLASSLARYLGVDVECCGPDSLAADLSRFRFLLSATAAGREPGRESPGIAPGARSGPGRGFDGTPGAAAAFPGALRAPRGRPSP